ncbi:hypothetical protein [Silvibacterium acidisoli]|uniref:hypothetical protein n=1 Tax=Acidobacteriaceae bacterium ZG23-2 TaxID=2883246 RepID=UPI00406CEA5A
MYLVCFGVGLALAVLSFLGGAFHFHGGHIHFGSHGHGAAAHGGGKASIAPINGFTITAFLCWFGGVGFLLHHYTSLLVPATLMLATAGGLAGAAPIFWLLARVLAPHERELTAEETQIVGVAGRVTGAMHSGLTGEVLFSQGGALRSIPARSENGEPLDRGTEVVVMHYERGIAYVRTWDAAVEQLPSAEHRSLQ